MRRRWVLAAIALAALLGCSGTKDEGSDRGPKEEVAVIQTDKGEIVVAFYDDVPGHVQNFKKLAASGFYEGTTFHRVIPGFMIQGGDPLSKDGNRGNDGTGGPDYTLPAEIKHKHILGAVASARKGDSVNPQRASNGSQFYICVEPQPFLDNGYTVFGHVVQGIDVARAIAAVPRDARDNPIDPVVIRKVALEQRRIAAGSK